MIIKGKGVMLAVSALGLILAGAGPALAQHGGGGGGGHGGGGGGHSGGGGGHSFSGGHAGGGAHFAGPGHFAGGGHVAGGFHGGATGYHGGGYAGHGAGFAGHGYYGGGGWRGGGGWHGGGGWRGAGWRGGYWHGGFWPRAFYGGGFSWFLPILPLAYATYWYSGVPYYYANDVYYTWNPTYDGYVATDPPPVADSSGSADVAGSGPAPAGDVAPDSGPGPGGPAAGQIFMYPKNGQSAEQQASDKAECQKWASDQAGQVAQNGSDYNRAMVACVEGRGYSAR
jgi:hypothetical protein